MLRRDAHLVEMKYMLRIPLGRERVASDSFYVKYAWHNTLVGYIMSVQKIPPGGIQWVRNDIDYTRLSSCRRSSILIKLLRLSGGVSLSLQPWLDVSFALLTHIACGFQLWHGVRLRIARTSPGKSRSWQKPLRPQPDSLVLHGAGAAY